MGLHFSHDLEGGGNTRHQKFNVERVSRFLVRVFAQSKPFRFVYNFEEKSLGLLGLCIFSGFSDAIRSWCESVSVLW